MEVDVQNLQPQLGVALGIPQNAKYPQKVLPEGTSTLWNVLEVTCSLADDSLWFPSVLSGSPLITK
jgi:hypothetical protein